MAWMVAYLRLQKYVCHVNVSSKTHFLCRITLVICLIVDCHHHQHHTHHHLTHHHHTTTIGAIVNTTYVQLAAMSLHPRKCGRYGRCGFKHAKLAT